MTEERTHHHMVADNVQIKLEMPAVDTKVISPEALRAGAIVQPEPWMVRHLMATSYRPVVAAPGATSRPAVPVA